MATESTTTPGSSGGAGKIQRVTTTVGEQLEATAEMVRERLPAEGRAGQVAQRFSDAISATGRYLQRSGYRGVMTDVEDLIRRHPAQALFFAAVLGFVISRFHRDES